MVDGTATKIRRVRCPRCSSVLVEDPGIPVYQCGKCFAVLRAKHCKSAANGNSSPGQPESTSCRTNTSVDNICNGSVSNEDKTMLGNQHIQSSISNVTEVISKNDDKTGISEVNLEAKVLCLDSSAGCSSAMNVTDNQKRRVPDADGRSENLERDYLSVEAQNVDVITEQSEIDNPKDEIPNLDGSSCGNSRQLSPEKEIDRTTGNVEVVFLNELHSSNANISEMENAKNEAPPTNNGSLSCNSEQLSPTADIKTENGEVRDEHEVPNLDGSSCGNSLQLLPEKEIDSTKGNAEVLFLNELNSSNANISEMENAKDEPPPINSGSSSCNSEQLSPTAEFKTENGEVKDEHEVLCDMLKESLNIGRDVSPPVRSPDRDEDHLELSHQDFREVNTDDKRISNGCRNPGENPSLAVNHAYDASISSFEDVCDRLSSQHRLISKRTLRSQQSVEYSRLRDLDDMDNSFVDTGAKKTSQSWRPEIAVPARLLKQRYSSETMGSIMSDTDELPTRHMHNASEDFYSANNWTETEKDTPSLKSFPRGSQFGSLGSDIELLRKLDELTQLALSNDQWDKKLPPHPSTGKKMGSWKSGSGGSSSGSERGIQDLPSIQSRFMDPYESRKSVLGRHQNRILPSSPQSDPGYFCRHCMPGHHPQANGRLPAATYCTNQQCGSYCFICSQSGNLKCHHHSDPHYVPPQKYSRDLGNLHHKVRDQSRKRHYRPVLGGANLVSCYECLKVLQIPEDFHFSRRKCNKLRCGRCSKVLSLALVNRNRIVPYSLALKWQLPTGGGVGNNIRNSDSTPDVGIHPPPRNHRFSQWGPEQDRYSEYGPFRRSCETEDEYVQYVSRDSTDSMIDRDIKKPPLHSLMGYISASEIIYNR